MKPKRIHIRRAIKAPATHKGQQPPRPPSSAPAFKALEWGEIKGLPVAWVPCDRPRPRDGSDLNGRLVIIDGTRYRCREVHITIRMGKPAYIRTQLSQPIQPGERIGLVVSGAN